MVVFHDFPDLYSPTQSHSLKSFCSNNGKENNKMLHAGILHLSTFLGHSPRMLSCHSSSKTGLYITCELMHLLWEYISCNHKNFIPNNITGKSFSNFLFLIWELEVKLSGRLLALNVQGSGFNPQHPHKHREDAYMITQCLVK